MKILHKEILIEDISSECEYILKVYQDEQKNNFTRLLRLNPNKCVENFSHISITLTDNTTDEIILNEIHAWISCNQIASPQ